MLVCFCAEALERVTDDALEVFDRALGAADRAAHRRHEELRRHHSGDTQTTVKRFIDLAQAVLEAYDDHADVVTVVERRIGLDRLREDLDRAQRINRPHGDSHLDLLIDGGAVTGRKLLAAVIASIELKRTGTKEDELLAALRLIAHLAGTPRRWLPGFSPSPFIGQRWRPLVVDAARGRLDRRAYELCAGYELRSALRADRVWVPDSRRHADPASYLLATGRWGMRPELRSRPRWDDRCARATV